MPTIRRSNIADRKSPFVLCLALLGFMACRPPPPGPGPIPFAHLFGPPEGRFVQLSSYDTTGGNVDRLEIPAGDSAVLVDHVGPGMIRRIWITVFSRDPHYLRRIAIRMYWDGESEPSVAAPLGDLFGNGFSKEHYAALPMGVSSGGFYSYLPMPFRERARIVVENGTGRTIDAFYYNIDVLEIDRLPADVATFHAAWNRDRRTTSPGPHRVLEARGAGHLVGLSLNAESHAGHLGFLEGDELYYVDGAFRGQGTGTEDYFNAGWYFDRGPFAAPYHGLVLKDDSLARIAAYRWHIPDPIPFRDSIRVELEHGHDNQEVADYATMAYWYQTEPHAPLPELPLPDARRVLAVKIPPAAMPAESLATGRRGDALRIKVPVPRPDRYLALVYPLGGPNRNPLRIRVAGGPPHAVPRETPEPRTPLPAVPLDTVTAIDSIDFDLPHVEPADSLLAAIEMRPVRRWAHDWNVVGPFPNPQRPGTEYSPAIDSVYGPERDPSLDTTYVGSDDRRVAWEPATAGDDGRVRLNALFDPNDWVAAYAQTYVYSPDARATTLLLGADDAHQLWVNGELLSTRQGRHVSVADEITVPVELEAGWNRILLKVADLDGGWAFMLRAADPHAELRWARRATSE